MNYKMIAYIIGQIVRVEGVLLLLPLATALIYGENTMAAFLIPSLAAIVIGTLMTIKKPANTSIFAR